MGISVQTLQPLIWLARRWTRLAVVSGHTVVPRGRAEGNQGFSASGTSAVMLVIRACMFSSAGFPCQGRPLIRGHCGR
jgi:hypothetical protein